MERSAVAATCARMADRTVSAMSRSVSGVLKIGSSHFYPSACWSATSTSHPCRGHSAVAPSLAIGTSLSAVDDMVCSPEPTFAALALAARATENTLKLTPSVVHGTEAQVTRPRTPSPTHRPTLAPTTHMHTIEPEDPLSSEAASCVLHEPRCDACARATARRLATTAHQGRASNFSGNYR